MTNDLAIIIPCRGRPEKLKALFDATIETKTNARLYIGLDDDDPTLEDYKKVCSQYELIANAGWAYDERIRMCPTLNRIARLMSPKHKYIGFMGDDHLPRTEGWTDKIIAELEKKPLSIVYGNDLLQGERLPTAVFLDSKIVKTLGYMCPPSLIHLYADNFWLDLGNALGTLTYMPHVIIEHMHFTAGKSAQDEQYKEVNSIEVNSADATAYARYKESQFNIDINKLKNALGN